MSGEEHVRSLVGDSGVSSSKRASGRRLALLAGSALIAASLTWSVASAQAVYHEQECWKNNGEGCYDVQGSPRYYYPWASVAFAIWYTPSAINGVCAKARKTDGTVKNNSACRDGRRSLQVYFDAPWIESQAFGYWYGGGVPGPVTTFAWTS